MIIDFIFLLLSLCDFGHVSDKLSGSKYHLLLNHLLLDNNRNPRLFQNELDAFTKTAPLSLGFLIPRLF